jgi:hypothetical protein
MASIEGCIVEGCCIIVVSRQNSYRILCKDDIEDEFHFVLKCQTFSGLRKQIHKNNIIGKYTYV